MVEYSSFQHEYKASAFPCEVPKSKDYKVYVNGREVPVYACRISAYPFNTWWPGYQRPVDQSEIASYVNLVSDEEIEITVEPLTKTAYERIMIKPYAKNILYSKQGEKIVFTLKENGGYILELDDYHGMLYIFNNKPCPCEAPENITYYFGKGVHFPGKIVLHSNESIYLEKDALVYGCVFAEDAENIRIYGNGVLDDSTEERISQHCYESYANGNLKFYDCNRVRIEGVGLVNSAIWCVNLFHCIDVEIDGINVFGQWRYNTDGVDIVNCRNITLKNSFVHSFDDTVTVKGIDRYREECNTDILIENCVLLCDWGKTMEIGLETECREYSRITFRDCHVVRGGNAACDIQNGDCATVHDITFENISIELESFYTKEQLQRSPEQIYEKKDTVGISNLLAVTNQRFRESYAFLNVGSGDLSEKGQPHYAAVRNIRVKNVSIYADEKIVSAYGNECVRISVSNVIPTTKYADISVENIWLNGQRIFGDDMNISINGCEDSVLTVK
jgi:hypothetical protein